MKLTLRWLAVILAMAMLSSGAHAGWKPRIPTVVKGIIAYHVGKKVVSKLAGKVGRRSEVPDRLAAAPKGSRGSPLEQPRYQQKRNVEFKVGNTTLTGHAQDQMQNRGIPLTAVMNAIRNGKAVPGRNGTFEIADAINGFRLILNQDKSKVITVITRGM